MIDLNHIFLFIAVISPLAVLYRAWGTGATYRGWRVASVLVLAITAIAWLFAPEKAGYVGGAVWVALLFLPAIGLRKVTELASRNRYAAARKLATALQFLHPSADLRQQVQWLRTLESQQLAGLSPSVGIRPQGSEENRARRLRRAPAVLCIILLLLAAFLFEISQGNWTDPLLLHKLGALEPYSVWVKGEYWRILAGLFLHYGAVHLLFNVFALYIIGPPLEHAIGTLRFSAAYLISGIGSSVGVVLLWRIGLTEADQLVGASGCVLGIVGAWAGFLLRHRHTPLAKQRLSNILVIVVVQVAFDLSTPQISMSAHLCGLITGLIFGLIVGPRRGRAGRGD